MELRNIDDEPMSVIQVSQLVILCVIQSFFSSGWELMVGVECDLSSLLIF